MDLQDMVRYATLAALGVGIWTLWAEGRATRAQMNVELFLAFTQRYEQLMRESPIAFRKWRLDTDGACPEVTEEVRTSLLAYLNLCSEEYYLRRHRYLDAAIWSIWEHELVRTLGSDLVQSEWPRMRIEFESFNEFCEFVETAQHRR